VLRLPTQEIGIGRLESNYMGATLLVHEETPSGTTLNEWNLETLTEKVTVRELIRSYVYQGFCDQQHKRRMGGRAQIEPTDYEKRLNSRRAAKIGQEETLPAWDNALDEALKAFREGRLLVLTGDHQQESLDGEIVVCTNMKVTFIKLVLLAGG
jgi:hypothetical protein